MTLTAALCFSAMSKISSLEPTSLDINFPGYQGLDLQGTLLLAPGDGPHPGMLLLPGSGPTDRDGNQGNFQTDLLKQIAYNLAAHGISSLRFDKRAVGSTYVLQFPKKREDYNDFFSWEAFTGDASAAFSTLKARKEIDPTQCGILGHSEGGLITLATAQKLDPKAVVLVATPARDLGAIIVEQLGEGYSVQFSSKAVVANRVAEAKRAISSIRESGVVPTDLSPDVAPIFPSYAAKYLRSIVTFDPAKASVDLTMPALLVQGDKDVQVSPTRDALVLKQHMQKPTLIRVPGASHNLKAVQGDADPAISGPVVPGVLDQISSWLTKQFKGN